MSVKIHKIDIRNVKLSLKVNKAVILTPLVSILDRMNLVIGHGGQNLDQDILIRSSTGHRIVQLLRVEIHNRCHQSDQQLLKVATALGLQVLQQILAKVSLVSSCNQLPLFIRSTADHVDDRVLIRAKALHSLAQDLGIGGGIEVG